MVHQSKIIKNKFHGVLLLDKPSGISSNQALSRIKRLYRPKKVGHMGTLDPLATGMLPIAFGDATKFSRFGLEADKSYRFRAKIGEQTDTFDAEGTVVQRSDQALPVIDQLKQVLHTFCGESEQIPPLYSALKWQGKPLYAWAREGHAIDPAVLGLKKRQVVISALRLLAYGDDFFEVELSCSKGTYIRSLVNDMGLALGCLAHVSQLRRLTVSPYREEQMIDLEALENTSVEDRLAYLLPVDCLVQHLAQQHLTTTQSRCLCQGQAVSLQGLEAGKQYRLYRDDGVFLGIGAEKNGDCWPTRLCQMPEP